MAPDNQQDRQPPQSFEIGPKGVAAVPDGHVCRLSHPGTITPTRFPLRELALVKFLRKLESGLVVNGSSPLRHVGCPAHLCSGTVAPYQKSKTLSERAARLPRLIIARFALRNSGLYAYDKEG